MKNLRFTKHALQYAKIRCIDQADILEVMTDFDCFELGSKLFNKRVNYVVNLWREHVRITCVKDQGFWYVVSVSRQDDHKRSGFTIGEILTAKEQDNCSDYFGTAKGWIA